MTMTWHGIPLMGKVREAALKEARKQAHYLLTLSKREVPKDTGDLMRSGGVNPTPTGAEVIYSKPYALRRHEEGPSRTGMTRVTKRAATGKAKFLEDPLRANTDKILAAIASAIKGAIK